MGTVINDFTNPEFVLFGVDDEQAAKVAQDFIRQYTINLFITQILNQPN